MDEEGALLMSDGITHNNKDVMFKVLSKYYADKSFAVYGLDVPRVRRMLPTNYPAVSAKEVYCDRAIPNLTRACQKKNPHASSGFFS